ncbi:MAG: hypothetical protein PHV61_06985 [Limnochordia bacterium]|nr:hypothetical protein [Limnochordia bacterium]MDD2629890.1 hypothetical protein [Limnochordia bacterium]MDD4518045.1 hypothetical protein [Limnochordia bacterium]
MKRHRLWVLLFILLNVTIGGMATKYVVEFWTDFLGNPISVSLLPAALAGLFVAPVTLPLAIATYIINLF